MLIIIHCSAVHINYSIIHAVHFKFSFLNHNAYHWREHSNHEYTSLNNNRRCSVTQHAAALCVCGTQQSHYIPQQMTQ